MEFQNRRIVNGKICFITKDTGLFCQVKYGFGYVWSLFLIHWIGFVWAIRQYFSPRETFNFKAHKILLEGKLAIVTGGASGIGAQVVRKLYHNHMHVIIGCRDIKKGEQLRRKLMDENHTFGSLEVLPLDLSSFDSIRKFATRVTSRNSRINLLVNNAGVMFSPRKVTEDNFEYQFQTNYLGHFLLTRLLSDALIEGGTASWYSRIVNVSSVAHYGGYYDPKTFDFCSNLNPIQAYMNSKFMLVVMSNYMNKKFQTDGSHVQICSVHPGIVNSNLYQHVFYHKWLTATMPFLYISPEEGAESIIYAALSPELEQKGGEFIINCKKHQAHGKSYDESVLKKVWHITCCLTQTPIARQSDRVRKPIDRYRAKIPFANAH